MSSHWGSIPREKMQEATRRERELKIKFGNERLEDCVRYIPFDPADHQTAWKALRTILCQYDRDLSGNDAALILGPQPNDSIILVTGLSGAGKSSLINHILGPNSKQKVKVGNQLEGCTQDVHAICTDMPVQLSHLLGEGDSGRLVLVDTPAFDGAYEGEMITLTRVANWLARSAPMTVRGVIYVHDMSESRITGSMRRYLWTLEKLCGEEMFGKLVIVTSKWDSVRPRESQGHLSPSQVGEERVEVFKMRAWNELINGGAIVRNFHPANQAQALEIVKLVLTNRSGVEDVPLAVQREIIVEGRELRQTSAAKGLLQGIHNNLDADVSSKVWFDKKIKQFWRV
ncbi:hypothetical protein CC1G_08617 [Coprinopsis cinerea okayama7|uniref:G domain-containing protein n=1 Tax=Coprinopsis cinerea (strain Okayama-7 / 130 / ATCC MYA-4618 / FGSC 9003) TaxID=240176 RepID=A8NCZ5_COPC7|nr:hypothetical protein CC1G_08617 [Coprinopsis cinerea okayama7\|eukprot:XP_001832667.1 hypothetical protein CC1G_08617 [Coprinopsis cinerea okayama7\